MSKVIIKYCDCKHDHQDKPYGKGMRVHNQGGSANMPKFKCTSCGKKSS